MSTFDEHFGGRGTASAVPVRAREALSSLAAESPRFTEVTNLQLFLSVHEQVLKLYVTVRNTLRVHVADTAEELPEVRTRRRPAHARQQVELLVERSSGGVAHQDAEMRVVINASFVLDQVFVLE